MIGIKVAFVILFVTSLGEYKIYLKYFNFNSNSAKKFHLFLKLWLRRIRKLKSCLDTVSTFRFVNINFMIVRKNLQTIKKCTYKIIFFLKLKNELTNTDVHLKEILRSNVTTASAMNRVHKITDLAHQLAALMP